MTLSDRAVAFHTEAVAFHTEAALRTREIEALKAETLTELATLCAKPSADLPNDVARLSAILKHLDKADRYLRGASEAGSPCFRLSSENVADAQRLLGQHHHRYV